MTTSVEIVARYLHDNAMAGKGVSGNPKLVANYLGISCSQLNAARDALVSEGRLVRGQQSYLSIDGVLFKNRDQTSKPHDPLFRWLRRRYDTVVDARVVDQPHKLPPKNTPSEVIIGGIRTGFAFACAAALCAPGSRLAW